MREQAHKLPDNHCNSYLVLYQKCLHNNKKSRTSMYSCRQKISEGSWRITNMFTRPINSLSKRHPLPQPCPDDPNGRACLYCRCLIVHTQRGSLQFKHRDVKQGEISLSHRYEQNAHRPPILPTSWLKVSTYTQFAKIYIDIFLQITT